MAWRRNGSASATGLLRRAFRGAPPAGALKRVQFRSRRNCPVRPAVDAVPGEKAYALLRAVPDRDDLVDVFRNPKYVGAIVEECISREVPAI